MAEGQKDRHHRLIDELDIDIETEGLEDEISFTRLQEIIEGYNTLLGTVNDERSYNSDDTRVSAPESAEKKASHAIYLSPARKGCWAATARVYDDSESEEQTLPLRGEGFTPIINIVSAIGNGNISEFEELLPSRFARKRALEAAEKICSKPNETIRVVSVNNPQIAIDIPKARDVDFTAFRPTSSSFTDGVVIGYITGVDFEGHKLSLRPNKDSRKFTIEYDPDIEDRLIMARKSPMVVNCSVRYDLNGNIAEIKDAAGIEELTIFDISVESFTSLSGDIVDFKEPLVVTVSLDEDAGQVLIGENGDLGVVVYAEHQGDLREETLNDLAWRWDAIALASDDDLASDALSIKKRFLEMVVG